ncbi:AIPR family protein [Clostridium botulinum]|uniref:AIPR family protein n=1 Tax=Clostridium sp. MIL1 TaxID=2949982 RepID=UPI002079CAC1|nr:AIPR family protein [Clostridium botulinum]
MKLIGEFVLVRMFNINEDDKLKNSIAEYTNGQNAISHTDLKSVDNIHIQIERYSKEAKVLYARKAGELGDSELSYEYRVSMERLAQILYSVNGYPDRSSNQKKRLFQEYYNEIFKCDKFTLEDALKYSNLFVEIEKVYKKNLNDIKYYEQKVFYIIYII